MRGQASILDGIIFMMIACSAAVLLIYVDTLARQDINKDFMNYYLSDWGAKAFSALHYVKDSDGNVCWQVMKEKVNIDDYGMCTKGLEQYLSNHPECLKPLKTSPLPSSTWLCFNRQTCINIESGSCCAVSNPSCNTYNCSLAVSYGIKIAYTPVDLIVCVSS